MASWRFRSATWLPRRGDPRSRQGRALCLDSGAARSVPARATSRWSTGSGSAASAVMAGARAWRTTASVPGLAPGARKAQTAVTWVASIAALLGYRRRGLPAPSGAVRSTAKPRAATTWAASVYGAALGARDNDGVRRQCAQERGDGRRVGPCAASGSQHARPGADGERHSQDRVRGRHRPASRRTAAALGPGGQRRLATTPRPSHPTGWPVSSWISGPGASTSERRAAYATRVLGTYRASGAGLGRSATARTPAWTASRRRRCCAPPYPPLGRPPCRTAAIPETGRPVRRIRRTCGVGFTNRMRTDLPRPVARSSGRRRPAALATPRTRRRDEPGGQKVSPRFPARALRIFGLCLSRVPAERRRRVPHSWPRCGSSSGKTYQRACTSGSGPHSDTVLTPHGFRTRVRGGMVAPGPWGDGRPRCRELSPWTAAMLAGRLRDLAHPFPREAQLLARLLERRPRADQVRDFAFPGGEMGGVDAQKMPGGG
jgi:hypothetical protein